MYEFEPALRETLTANLASHHIAAIPSTIDDAPRSRSWWSTA